MTPELLAGDLAPTVADNPPGPPPRPRCALAVGPEEVVSGQSLQAAGRGLVAEGAVWSSVVVVLEPDGESGGALVAVVVDRSVGPFGEQGADEPFRPCRWCEAGRAGCAGGGA